jgi:hypothetical protein
MKLNAPIVTLFVAVFLLGPSAARAVDGAEALVSDDVELTVQYYKDGAWADLSRTDQDRHLNIARCECGESIRVGAKLLASGLAKVRSDAEAPVVEGTLYYGRNCNDLQARDACEELGSKEIGGGKAIDESVAIARFFAPNTSAPQACAIGKNVSGALWLVLQKDGEDLTAAISRSLRVNGKVPATPTIKKALPGNESIALEWETADDDTQGYQVLCSGGEHDPAESAFEACNTTINEDELCSGRVESNKVTVKGLVNGAPYGLRLISVDEAGNVSAPSAVVNASPEASQGFAELYDESGGTSGGCTVARSRRGGRGALGALTLFLLLVGTRLRRARSLLASAVLLLVLVVLPTPGHAQLDLSASAFVEPPAVAPWRVSIGLGWYRPAVDQAFTNLPERERPFGKLFGTEREILPTLELQRTLVERFGVVTTGLSVGYQRRTASALTKSGKGVSADETSFLTVPVSWSVMWFGDFTAHGAPFPLVPYVRAGLDGFAYNSDGPGETLSGATFGYHHGVGLELSLSRLDPNAARAMAAETGMAQASLYAEWTRYQINDFGADDAMNLSDTQFSLGLMVGF